MGGGVSTGAVVAIDPGCTNTGMVHMDAHRVIACSTAHFKERVGSDNDALARRCEEVWQAVREFLDTHPHDVVVVEGYRTCRPCELRALVARAESETAAAMERLGPADRAVYASTETRLQSAPDPRPAPPRTEGMTPYRAARARDAYREALERWEVRTLTRLLKARRRRLERMIKKISNQ